jgi:enamine deaminase RidA (YjgF/YER057c/UK114 family)
VTGVIDQRLIELDLELPNPAAPAANYVPYVVSGSLVFVSGQITAWNGEIKHTGIVGDNRTLEDGYQAARICGLNLIAQVKEACGGDLDRVRRVVKLGGFVACKPEFKKHPLVINGASDLMADVFGDKGQHARFAVGAAALPVDTLVEIDGIFEIE